MLHLVPTPVGNLEDITLRALRLLREASLVLAEDTRTSGMLLKHYDIAAKLVSHHKFNEHETAQHLAQRMAAGEDMVLISDAGTPAISDPGFLLVRAAIEHGVKVECLPGATAFVPALVVSGLPCERFCFEGFLPQKKGRSSKLEALCQEERTMIFYESPHRIHKTLQQMALVFGQERRCAAVREISKRYEETIRGTLAEVAAHFGDNEARGEFVLIVAGNTDHEKQARQDAKKTTPLQKDPITGQILQAHHEGETEKAQLRRSKRHR